MAVAFKAGVVSDYTVQNSGLTNTFQLGNTNKVGSLGTISAGDKGLAILSIKTNNAGDPGVVSVVGWTVLEQYFDNTDGITRHALLYRDMAGGDAPSSWVASWTTASYGASFAVALFSGAATGAPTYAASHNTSSASMTAPSVTPATASDMLVCLWGQSGNKGAYDFSSLTSMTVQHVASTGSTVPECASGCEQLASASATGTRVATQGGGASTNTGYSIILTVPAAGVGATSPTLMMMGV